MPIPSLESISIRIECGTLPSIIDVFFTPRLTASTQQSIFGILGVAVVYQDLALADHLDVAANIWLGAEHKPVMV